MISKDDVTKEIRKGIEKAEATGVDPLAVHVVFLPPIINLLFEIRDLMAERKEKEPLWLEPGEDIFPLEERGSPPCNCQAEAGKRWADNPSWLLVRWWVCPAHGYKEIHRGVRR